MIDANEFLKIKNYLHEKVDQLEPSKIIKRSDPVLLIDYFSFRLGKTEVVIPTHVLPLLNNQTTK